MENTELMQALLDLCAEAELDVRLVGAAGLANGESPPGSAVCRVRGKLWIVLSRGDPVDVQLRVLASALRDHAGELLESRYLPPALRELLGAGEG
ncbi:MAG: hypothetical protein JRG96_18685 [Deltaproteobacteria bacterium]|nr:hypothetical protein [Deltaproteobacteria bacterium]MBW2419734.1 hypothetical protein [Deltaproteobacteria bacterium]